MSNKPKEPPLKDSLEKLAEFTKRILQVPRSELPDKHASIGSRSPDTRVKKRRIG